MPIVNEHPEGMPCWIDMSVDSSATREALMKFYSGVFGWSFDVNGPEMGFYSIARSDGQAVMAIGEQPEGAGAWVVYFSTSDIEGACQRASAAGGQVFVPPMPVPGVGTMALVLDPVGVVHGFWQPLTFKGIEMQYEVNTPGWFDHYSRDPEKASAYYDAALGSGVSLFTHEGMAVLQYGDQWFASVTGFTNFEKSPQWTPIFIVSSLDETAKKVRELGGTVVSEHIPVPGSALSVFKDPVLGQLLTVMHTDQQDSAG